MIRALARKVARIIAPLVFQELVSFLEELLKTDIDGDGKIGNDE
jgi:hypothetical protein